MQINPYLNFNGNCEAAFKFYERCLRGKIEAVHTFAGSPMEAHLPPEHRNKVMHVRLSAAGAVLMGSDAMGDRYSQPKGMAVSLQVEDPAEAERLFKELSEKGKVDMPIGETFWALRFAMFTDQFGIPWMINCERPS